MKISKTIHVKRPVGHCFRVFTEQIGEWWPLEQGFSYGRERAQDIFIEGRVGGRIYERFTDGTEYEIGRVAMYEPPHRVSFSWSSPEWEGPTQVEVRFVADGTGTRVELEHGGWEVGPKAQTAGKGFASGWDIVLARYAAAAAQTNP
jgi:uncharacterized protein YndB with AHSA1/START domain